jgi:serine/threonine protein phosphatase 1
MIDAIRQLFRPKPAQLLPTIPAGERVYAIGDVHGRLDLFAALVDAIEKDDATRGPADTTVILLGDLVDRGPESAAVVEAARAWQRDRKVRMLLGNHEEMFVTTYREIAHMRNFLRYGGRETVLSYGIDPEDFHIADIEEAHALMRGTVPESDIQFLENFEDCIAIGDYAFVHAGIRPREPLEQQRSQDLRWIREPFLSHSGDHSHVIVHGHTITDDAEIKRNRIGIDTGAYASGRLTALGLEGTTRWLLEAREEDEAVTTSLKRLLQLR